MTENGTVTLDLPAELQIRNLEELKSELLRALQFSTVTLNAAAVSRADTAGMQLLLSFLKSAEAAGIRVRWQSPSETFTSIAGILGMDRSLS